MSKLLRHYSPDQTYFVTAVTHRWIPILIDNWEIFRRAMRRSAHNHNYELSAWVVMPDHIHLIVDPKSLDLSTLMQKLKLSFSVSYRHRTGRTGGMIWQARFWDHIIRDQTDMNHHVDYIHYNPVKHGLVDDPFAWSQSSIHTWYEAGFYFRDWGQKEHPRFDGEFGE